MKWFIDAPPCEDNRRLIANFFKLRRLIKFNKAILNGLSFWFILWVNDYSRRSTKNSLIKILQEYLELFWNFVTKSFFNYFLLNFIWKSHHWDLTSKTSPFKLFDLGFQQLTSVKYWFLCTLHLFHFLCLLMSSDTP